jgi:hypothetical protein
VTRKKEVCLFRAESLMLMSVKDYMMANEVKTMNQDGTVPSVTKKIYIRDEG